jgi:hypothetical protein
VLNPMIPLDPRGEGVFDIFDRSTHQPSAPDMLDEDLFSRRNQQDAHLGPRIGRAVRLRRIIVAAVFVLVREFEIRFG